MLSGDQYLHHLNLILILQRFGKGIYLTPNSCKAHGYTGTGNRKAIIVSKVALGKTKVAIRGDKTLNGSLFGYDSIFGKPGAELNWPEYVVFNENQILPVAAIIYRC
jgi:hypothetical protein